METNKINNSGFLPLCHSALKVKDAVNQVIPLGMSALAITNYDSIYATHELAKYANSVTEDLKTIVGCEMHVAPIYKADKKKLILQKLLI